MQVEVVLQYGGLLISVVDYRASFEDALYHWTEGPASCDCGRSEYLQLVGAIDNTLPCSDHVRLHSIKPYTVH